MTMYNAVYCEFLKLKRSPISLLLILGIVAEPLIMLFGQLYRQDIVEWEIYMGNIEAMMFLVMGLIFFTLIASYTYAREFTERVSCITYSYPISKTKVFVAKLLTLFTCIFIVYVLQFITMIITGCSIDHEPLDMNFVMLNIKIYFYSMLFQFAITPLAIFITSVSKNLVLPMIYSIIGTLINLVVGQNQDYSVYFPLCYPSVPLMSLKFNNMKLIINKYTIEIAIVFFIITILASIFYYEKCDIS
ncbi:ABC-2 family transporter protein [Clostridium acetireducens DSM 10703]|uniref:ABC-2 family transporter protein n=1 Tax=Clostridium acetireducens DSM 10703 TaxID=1121290 RepID=A0A1E8EYR4_9CLOT|nr:ABC transporter permease [Clostridium acetireducens]OFI05996.1 ABC-2 family transporter protein [Clostridium acetireducens DSM 10703]